jgi:uncharacterized damage-inducible protein DinB
MFSRHAIRELYRHMEWADAKVWEAVPLAAEPPDEILRERLVHIHVVQRAFLYAWTGGPVTESFKSGKDFPTLAAARAWAQPYYGQAYAFLDSLPDDRLGETVTLPWAAMIVEHLGRNPAPTTLADTCFQVASHSTYHRGQVNIRLREIGAEPPLVDYIAWAWFDKPAADWKTGV